jgi:3-hydroxyacyl-CoA dehydrogenase
MEIKKIAVIGCGTMGHGIAQTYAANGYKTVCTGRSESSLETAKKLVASNVKTMLDAGFITEAQAKAVEENLTFSTDMQSAAADADYVVEASPEDPQVKAGVFQQLDAICRPDAILTSTTSAMNIYQFIKVSHPERLLIVHWNNPPHILPLVEIVAGPETDKEIVAQVRAMLEAMDKKPVVLNTPIPGFIVNRLNLALMREAAYLVEQGWATAEDVNAAFVYNQGMKAPFEGPLQTMDFIGWDVAYGAGKMLYPAINSSVEPSPMALQMIQEGRLGLKTGKGLYDYSDRSREEVQAERDQKVMEVVKLARKLAK